MNLSSINWQPTCCGWHGEYAEAPTRDGGVMRLRRAPDGSLQVARFDRSNRAIDRDDTGAPRYVDMTEAEVAALL